MGRFPRRAAFWLPVLLLASGCGSGGGSFTIAGAINATEGLILETEEVVQVKGSGGVYQPGDTDFYLLVGETGITLKGSSGGAFCFKEGSFQDVEDIPSDDAGCFWTDVRLGDPDPAGIDASAGDGYLVRDRTGTFIYRMRIAAAEYKETGIAEVHFDILPIEDDS